MDSKSWEKREKKSFERIAYQQNSPSSDNSLIIQMPGKKDL
jgi:hypothetical protein